MTDNIQADLREFTNKTSEKIVQLIGDVPKVPGVDIALDTTVQNALEAAKDTFGLEDAYTIGLWNYCSGPFVDGVYKPSFCSPKTRNFYFNPIEIWHLSDTGVENVLPPNLIKALKIYKKASYWNIVAHIIAIALLSGSFVLGLFAMCSRLVSFFVTIMMVLATLFTVASAVSASIIYSAISGAFETALRPYGISSSLGSRGYALEWIGVAFAIAASFFWSISICCCRSKPSSPAYKRVPTEKPHHHGHA